MATRKQATATTVEKKKQRFLRVLAQTGQVTAAAKAAKSDRTTFYRWREKDKDFADAWDGAWDLGGDALEDEARRRALAGSDTLLIFLLKAHKPNRYRERSDVRVEGGMSIDIGEARQGLVERIAALRKSGARSEGDQ